MTPAEEALSRTVRENAKVLAELQGITWDEACSEVVTNLLLDRHPLWPLFKSPGDPPCE